MSMDESSSSSYWCYRCHRFINVPTHLPNSSFLCPDCNGGFVEELNNPTRTPETTLSDPPRRRFPARPNPGDRLPSNPVIVLRGHTSPAVDSGAGGGFDMYYDDGAGSGLRPLPGRMSDFLLGSGFDRVINQLTQIEVNGLGRFDRNPPASKSAIEALQNVEIQEIHIVKESHCAVCKDPFELQTEAKEMPCQHLYHSDCILPWLNLRNSCPVCRHELPVDNNDQESVSGDVDESTVGLTIWRLPSGGFAVGRRGGERDVPVFITEMDGEFDNYGWGSRGNGGGGRGGVRRVLSRMSNMFTCFGGGGGGRGFGYSSSSSSSSSSDDGVMSRTSRFIPAIFSSSSRRQRAWALDVSNRPQMW